MVRALSLVAVVLLCVPLSACRSKKGCCDPCAPDPCCPPSQPIASAPCLPAPAPDPMVVYEPQPAPSDDYIAPSQDEFDDIAADLDRRDERIREDQAIMSVQSRELADLRERNRILREEVENRAQPAPRAAPVYAPQAAPSGCTTLATSLRSMGGLEVIEDGNDVVVRVTDAFRPGSEKLKPDARLVAALRDAAAALKQHPGATVSVVGHSDATPISKSGWASNTALSLARAQTVKGVLADNGIQATRIAVDGRGEMEPLIAPERTSSDRARNRRVEITIRF